MVICFMGFNVVDDWDLMVIKWGVNYNVGPQMS